MLADHMLLKDKMQDLDRILKKTLLLSRQYKRIILILNDLFWFAFSLWISFSIVSGTFWRPDDNMIAVLVAGPLVGVISFYYARIYKMVTRFSVHSSDLFRIFLGVSVAVAVWSLLFSPLFFNGKIGGVVPFLYWMQSLFWIWFSRQVAIFLLQGSSLVVTSSLEKAKPVLVYGAGGSGSQLVQALRNSTEYRIEGFVDDNPTLWRQKISSFKVYPPDALENIIASKKILEIFLAVPSSSRSEKREIINRLRKLPVLVKTLPAMKDIVSGVVSVNDLKPVSVDDLLGREPVLARQDLLEKTILGKTVMITGAGGSIGSELCRQVMQHGPDRLLLLEHSEFALYQIEQELIELQKNSAKKAHEPSPHKSSHNAGSAPDAASSSSSPKGMENVKIIPLLGSVLNEQRLERTFKSYQIDTIFHAAAYKHVPLVEMNPIDGLKNNVSGTYNTARFAARYNVGHFVLISTDKAVRPTNVMGASKRLSELVVQAMNDEKQSDTRFCMVRFGNVLDSSGSVVRKFREQIMNGGPVTVTHKDIVRYFMSIPEAAQLVIQAAAMAKGGDVFVLDMGEPIKILDLAKSMIRLMGREWWMEEENREVGDIEIRITGLRPGEKLYEELEIVANTEPTDHPQIIRNHEPFLSLFELQEMIKELDTALYKADIEVIRKILKHYVEGYQPFERKNTLTGKPVPSGAKI